MEPYLQFENVSSLLSLLGTWWQTQSSYWENYILLLSTTCSAGWQAEGRLGLAWSFEISKPTHNNKLLHHRLHFLILASNSQTEDYGCKYMYLKEPVTFKHPYFRYLSRRLTSNSQCSDLKIPNNRSHVCTTMLILVSLFKITILRSTRILSLFPESTWHMMMTIKVKSYLLKFHI